MIIFLHLIQLYQPVSIVFRRLRFVSGNYFNKNMCCRLGLDTAFCVAHAAVHPGLRTQHFFKFCARNAMRFLLRYASITSRTVCCYLGDGTTWPRAENTSFLSQNHFFLSFLWFLLCWVASSVKLFIFHSVSYCLSYCVRADILNGNINPTYIIWEEDKGSFRNLRSAEICPVRFPKVVTIFLSKNEAEYFNGLEGSASRLTSSKTPLFRAVQLWNVRLRRRLALGLKLRWQLY
jgi:hypothetical protein